ncbi:flavodoxin [Schinkia sp. CFF1]
MMSKILIVYASMTGNTEMIANLVEASIKECGFPVVRKEAIEVEANEIFTFDEIILGTYTWGEGDIPDEFFDFFEDMDGIDLTGKRFAIFGSGDPSYEHFCGAVDKLGNMILEKGGQLMLEGLKIELYPEGAEENRCKEFGTAFAESLKRL